MKAANNHLGDRAYLASVDAHRLEALCRELRRLEISISCDGSDGNEHYEKVREMAPGAIKALANYLPN